jgi:hypothetical protein
MGLPGVLTFGAILACFAWNFWRLRAAARRDPAGRNAFEHHLGAAVAMSIFLILFEGNFGHNLFRHNWLWFGGFLIIALYVVQKRKPLVASRSPAFAAGRVYTWRARVGAPT